MSKPKTNRMERIRKNEEEERKKQRGRGKRDRDFFVSRIVGPRKIEVAENTIAVAEKTFWSQVAEITVLVRAVADSALRSQNKKKL